MQRIVLATHNRHKTEEFRELLRDDCEVRDLSGVAALDEIAETGDTFAENATIKARAASRVLANELVVADDSGLEVDALNGAPGVFSARYAGANASDAENIAKLLREVRGRTPARARFRCLIAIARAGELLRTFDGVVEGKLIDAPRGAHGFGYDPVFVADGFEQTFAELPVSVKNSVSHRARAVDQLREFLGSER